MNPAELAAQILRLGPDHGEAVQEIVHAAIEKADNGARKYGPLNITTDDRDFFDEGMTEALDLINYLAIANAKLRRQVRQLQQALDRMVL